jgi:GST-like protein
MSAARRAPATASLRVGRGAAAAAMLTLYGKRGSGSAAVEAALSLAGVPFRIVETASWERNDVFAELLKINPLGQIPTLVLADGRALSESAAILMHLGLTYPESGLLPRGASERAQALRGLVFIAANCYAAISVIDFPERWCAGADDDDALKERIRDGARARLHRHWEIFADLFPARPWLGGRELGALDLHAAVVSKWSGARKHLEQKRPTFFATLQRIEAHPKVAQVFANHWPPRKQ